jgi:hypothetical protein
MKTRSLFVPTVFLQTVIVLVGLGAAAFLLWEPHVEGRNRNATLFAIYFNDPFLAFAYAASLSFFAALYQGFKVIGYARTGDIFSQAAVRALRTIRICAIVLIGCVFVGEAIILPHADDRPPPLVMGLVIILGSTVVASAASVLERILQDAIAMRAETPDGGVTGQSSRP